MDDSALPVALHTRLVVAQRLNCSVHTVDRLLERGLKSVKIGRMVRIREDDLEAFIANLSCGDVSNDED